METIILFCLFFFNDTATTEIYTLSLHDALPICLFDVTELNAVHARMHREMAAAGARVDAVFYCPRSEEHTSELQSHSDLVCRLLLEKKKKPNHKLSRKQQRIPKP